MNQHQNRMRCVLAAVLAGAVALLIASAASAAGLWSTAQMVGPSDSADSIFPSVEVSPDGTVWIVWSSSDPVQGDSETYYVTIRDFVQSSRQKIHEDNSIMDRCPIMSMGSDGVAWVVWERYSSTCGYQQVVTHWTGEAWAPADTVFALGDRWDGYTIHASSSSDVWVAKSSRAAGRADRDIFVRHWDGTGWGAAERVGFDDWEDMTPAVTTDDSGRTWLAWTRYDMSGHYRDFVYAVAHAAGGWSQPSAVDTTEGNLGVEGMGVCPDGRLMVAWCGGGYSPTSDIEYATLGAGGWEYGGLINKPDDVNREHDGNGELDTGACGEFWAIWVSGVVGEWPSAITASKWWGDAWGDEELVSAPDTLSLMTDTYPDVAVAGDGRVWAVWERQQHTSPNDTDIYVACRDVATAVEVWGLRTVVDGASVLLSWQASPGAARAGFHVWRAGAMSYPGQTGSVPADAVRLSDIPVRDCTSCAFTDDTAAAPGICYYWLEQPGGAVFGPATAAIPVPVRTGLTLAVSPNPGGDGAVFQVAGMGTSGEIRIYSAGGRLVRALAAPERSGSEAQTIHLDGVDATGHRMPSGVYYAVLREQGSAADLARVRFVLLR